MNGKDAERLFFEKELDISEVTKAGENEIEIRFVLDNRNRMGPHHLKGNKDGTVSPGSFELNGTWEEDQSIYYHEDYDLKKFF